MHFCLYLSNFRLNKGYTNELFEAITAKFKLKSRLHGVHKNFKLKFQDISRTFQDKNSVFPGQFLPVENHGENQEVILICLLQL